MKKQDVVWQSETKCNKLQNLFGDYDDFETNVTNNLVIANRQSVYFITKKLLQLGDYSLLEVGPGPGHFLWALKDYATELYGLDYSEHMIGLCTGQFEGSGKEIYLTKGVCWELPYRDNFVDVSLQCDVCRHVGGCLESLKEQIRVSKKYVVFSGPSFESWGLDQPDEKEFRRLMFGVNIDIFNKELDEMKSNGIIKDYYYKDRPNKKDRIKRKILVVECS